MKKKESFKFNSPFTITEKLHRKDAEGKELEVEKLKVRGCALKARISRNGVLYEMSEIQKSAKTLEGKPIGVNHTDDVTDICGRVETTIETEDGLDYEGWVVNTGKHPYVVEMIEKGLINQVSIEAYQPEVHTNKEGHKVAENFEFMGLGLVRHAGIPEASLNFEEALGNIIKEEVEEKTMIEEKTSPPVEEVIKTSIEAMSQQLTEGISNAVKEKVDISKLEEKLKALEEEMARLKDERAKGAVMTEAVQTGPRVFSTERVLERDMPKEAVGCDFLYAEKGSGKATFFALHPEKLY